MIAVELKNISYSQKKQKIIENINLSIEQGSIFAISGPSGAGKSTLLGVISGFLSPDSGNVKLFGKSPNDYPARDRIVTTVWQNKALFPHMSVYQNIAFGLKIRHFSDNDIKKKVDHIATLLQLSTFLERKKIDNLSGGEKQRVAIARALIVKPKLVLLDEPFTGLDSELKLKLSADLQDIQEELGTTFVLVTHNYSDIVCLANHVVIMNKGKIIQSGNVSSLYESPKDSFIVRFVGKRNILKGVITHMDQRGQYALTQTSFGSFWGKTSCIFDIGTEVSYCFNYDCVDISTSHDNQVQAIFRSKQGHGRFDVLYFRLKEGVISSDIRIEVESSHTTNHLVPRGRVNLSWSKENAFLLEV